MMAFLRALSLFRRKTKNAKLRERVQSDDELATTDNDLTSLSSRDCCYSCTLPSWRVENFLICDSQAESWQCRVEDDDESARNTEKFCHRGEQLWHCTREAWLKGTYPNGGCLSKPLSQKGTQALVKFMKEKEGAHPLPRRVPLSCMVQIYNQHVWNDLEVTPGAHETEDLQHV